MGFASNNPLESYLDCLTNSIPTSVGCSTVFFEPASSPRRKMMDSGQIDFYQHDSLCSNTCRSTKFDVLINSMRLPPGTSVQPSPTCLALDLVGGQVPPPTGRF